MAAVCLFLLLSRRPWWRCTVGRASTHLLMAFPPPRISAIMHTATTDVHEQVCVRVRVFISLGKMPSNGTAGSYCTHTESCKPSFQGGCHPRWHRHGWEFRLLHVPSSWHGRPLISAIQLGREYGLSLILICIPLTITVSSTFHVLFTIHIFCKVICSKSLALVLKIWSS